MNWSSTGTSYSCHERVTSQGVAFLCQKTIFAVCLPDWKFLPFKKDKCRIHVIRQKVDIDFCGNELHRYIVADPCQVWETCRESAGG